jgi:peptide-methionine (S)-S-oxide reductase
MRAKRMHGLVSSILFVAGLCGGAVQAAPASQVPSKEGNPAMERSDTRETNTLPQAMFGAGCFWGVESAFREVDGVVETAAGYSGGKTENPTYPDVCSHTTGHAEVVLVTYDPDRVSYEQLLDVFWRIHDPTQLDRQGPDIGDQYRSAVFTFTEAQRKAAESSREKLRESGAFGKREIVTQIAPASTFYRAEEVHQQYWEKRGRKGCPRP